jgi:hypothetical protein
MRDRVAILLIGCALAGTGGDNVFAEPNAPFVPTKQAATQAARPLQPVVEVEEELYSFKPANIGESPRRDPRRWDAGRTGQGALAAPDGQFLHGRSSRRFGALRDH